MYYADGGLHHAYLAKMAYFNDQTGYPDLTWFRAAYFNLRQLVLLSLTEKSAWLFKPQVQQTWTEHAPVRCAVAITWDNTPH